MRIANVGGRAHILTDTGAIDIAQSSGQMFGGGWYVYRQRNAPPRSPFTAAVMASVQFQLY